MSTPTSAAKPTITLIGFLRNDPIERLTRERTCTRKVSDPGSKEGFFEQKVTLPAKPYWKLSLDVRRGGKTERHDCVIWNPGERPTVESADRAREGNRVLLTGYHEPYTFVRNWETVSGRHFVVETFERIG
jgi:hypothetical protein